MTSNRTIEILTYAINALSAERGPPKVIYSDKESNVVTITKINQLQDTLFKEPCHI